MGSSSRLDHIIRSLALSKFFVRGWGNPENIQRLFNFRKIVSNRDKCQALVDRNHPVTITKEEKHKTYTLFQGHFASPFAAHLPGVVPKESEIAHFEMLIPKEWKWKNGSKPMVVHLAGTGDHFFWRRRMLMAKPLLNQWTIGSIILENPFYGLRKPKDQMRSCLHNVSDIFVMGGSLILESLVLFHWCELNGLGPLGVTGVSMGGHMASLAASSWPKPIVLVPCLSWSTASSVFTRGVMSGAIDWDLLETQYRNNATYNNILQMIHHSSQSDCAFQAGKQFAQNCLHGIWDHSVAYQSLKGAPDQNLPLKSSNCSMQGSSLTAWRRLLQVLPSPSSSNSVSDSRPKEEEGWANLQEVRAGQEALQFMRGIMDEFTHIANYTKPVDCSSIVVIAARDDAYVPREGTVDLNLLWPGSELRYVPTGHIGAYVLHHPIFRQAVKDAFDRLISLHGPGPILRHPSLPQSC